MEDYFERLNDLDNEILELSYTKNDSIKFYEGSIELIINKLILIRKSIQDRGFTNQDEEIFFFKKVKPQFVAKLIYYNSIYKIETRWPYGGDKSIKKYLNLELTKIKRYFDSNLEFYKYYRTNSSYLDHRYFIRGEHDIKLCLDTFYFEVDHSFSTSHDYKVAKILANDLIQVFLEDKLHNLNRKTDLDKEVTLIWTGSKVALIELIYSLYYQGTFNNGSVDIKNIAKTFENMFNINLGDFYHTYLELRSRKNNRTKFIDTLRETLIKKMDEQEER